MSHFDSATVAAAVPDIFNGEIDVHAPLTSSNSAHAATGVSSSSGLDLRPHIINLIEGEGQIQWEYDQLVQERNALEQERDALEQERDVLEQELDNMFDLFNEMHVLLKEMASMATAHMRGEHLQDMITGGQAHAEVNAEQQGVRTRPLLSISILVLVTLLLFTASVKVTFK